jgi:hypothetical protein
MAHRHDKCCLSLYLQKRDDLDKNAGFKNIYNRQNIQSFHHLESFRRNNDE